MKTAILIMVLTVGLLSLAQVSGQVPPYYGFPTTSTTTVTGTTTFTVSDGNTTTLKITMPVAIPPNNNMYFGYIPPSSPSGCVLFQSFQPNGIYVLLNLPSNYTTGQVTVYGQLINQSIPCYFGGYTGSSYPGIYVYSITSGFNYGGGIGQATTKTTTSTTTNYNVVTQSVPVSVTSTATTTAISTVTSTLPAPPTTDALGGLGVWILVGVVAIVVVVIGVLLAVKMMKGGNEE